MQTFIPVSDFQRCAEMLDNKRLGKQRVEVLQILKGQFKHHPVHRMWHNCTSALCYYGMIICHEWIKRGFKDTCEWKIKQFCPADNLTLPSWLGQHDFHKAHRKALFVKSPEHYKQFPEFSDVIGTMDYTYIWPHNTNSSW